MEPIRHASVLDLLLGPQLKWGQTHGTSDICIIRKKKSSCKTSKQVASKIITSKPYNAPNTVYFLKYPQASYDTEKLPWLWIYDPAHCYQLHYYYQLNYKSKEYNKIIM